MVFISRDWEGYYTIMVYIDEKNVSRKMISSGLHTPRNLHSRCTLATTLDRLCVSLVQSSKPSTHMNTNLSQSYSHLRSSPELELELFCSYGIACDVIRTSSMSERRRQTHIAHQPQESPMETIIISRNRL